MLYQFLDWRIGIHRRLMICTVESVFARLRKINSGKLPYCLRTWEEVTAFAGESSIPLPEVEKVAEALFSTDAYPCVKWVREQYEKMLEWLGKQEEGKILLVDPTDFTTPDPTLEELRNDPDLQRVHTKGFAELIEGSVSNVEAKPCSEPLPATLSPTSTLTDLPNYSPTRANPLPPPFKL